MRTPDRFAFSMPLVAWTNMQMFNIATRVEGHLEGSLMNWRRGPLEVGQVDRPPVLQPISTWVVPLSTVLQATNPFCRAAPARRPTRVLLYPQSVHSVQVAVELANTVRLGSETFPLEGRRCVDIFCCVLNRPWRAPTETAVSFQQPGLDISGPFQAVLTTLHKGPVIRAQELARSPIFVLAKGKGGLFTRARPSVENATHLPLSVNVQRLQRHQGLPRLCCIREKLKK